MLCYTILRYVTLCYGIGTDPCLTGHNPLRRAKRVAQERCEAASCHKDLVAQNLFAQERCEAASCHKDWVGQNLVAQQCKLLFRISFSLTKKMGSAVWNHYVLRAFSHVFRSVVPRFPYSTPPHLRDFLLHGVHRLTKK